MEPSQCVPKLWSMISILKHNTHAIHVRIMLKFQCLNIYNYRSNLWKNIGTNFFVPRRELILPFFSFLCSLQPLGKEERAAQYLAEIWKLSSSPPPSPLLLLCSILLLPPFSSSFASVPLLWLQKELSRLKQEEISTRRIKTVPRISALGGDKE